jgi:nitrate reductase NapA
MNELTETGTTRRDFLKLAGVSTAAIGLGGLSGCRPAGETYYLVDGIVPDLWKKGVCRYCGTGCGVEVGLKDARVVAIRGNRDYPVNKGVLCLKGLTLAHVVYSAERGTKPLLRQGDGYAETDWDQAFDRVAAKLTETIREHGPDAVAIYLGAQLFTEEFYIANKLFKGVLGSNNVEANARLCMASAVTGFMTTFGKDEPPGGYDDIEHADCFFLIGANLAENHPIIFGRILQRRAENRDVKIIVADPRMTPTAAHADLWLPFFPGTDLALLNAMAYVLLEEGHADERFMAEHVTFAEGGGAWGEEKRLSLEEYRRFLADYKPEKVADEVGIPVADIYAAARLFGKSRESMSLWTMGLNQRRWGTWANNLVYNLHLLTGKICRRGSTALSMTGQPNACGGIRECGTLAHALPAHRLVTNDKDRDFMERHWGVPSGSISPKPGLHTMAMFEKLCSGEIKFMWVICSNPAQSLPDINKYAPGMRDTFLVVQDIFPPSQAQSDRAFPNKTAEFADVFLPSAFWIEKGGVLGNTERRSMFTEPMIAPPPGLLHDWQIMVEIARRAGYGQYFPYRNTREIWDEYRAATKGTDMDLYGATYEVMLEKNGVQWPSTAVGDGGSPRRYELGTDRHLQRLAQEGRVQVPADGILFYGKPDGRARIFKRPQMPPAEVPDKEYPLYLTTGRVIQHWHTGTMTMRVPWLEKAAPQAFVEMNQIDAEALGIKDNQPVRLRTRRGELTLRARIVRLNRLTRKGLSERVSIPRPGVVFVPFFDARLLANELTIDAVDDMSKQPEYKICACRVERV